MSETRLHTFGSRFLTVGLLFWLTASLFAQTTAQENASQMVQRSFLTITASAAGDRVRIAAPSSVVQMRLEVYGAGSEKLFDQEIRGGNVFDWHVQDGQAQRLAAGTYICVVTAKNISGKLTQKMGMVIVEEKSVSAQPADAQQLSVQQAQTIGPVEENPSWTIPAKDEQLTTTVIAHDGTDGQLTRGRGALSFRLGDFFSGKDTEQMRLTEEGNLGIGTTKPKARLDVAGTIRARGFMFSDGSTLKINDKGVLTRISADGITTTSVTTTTQNKIAKFTDNVGTVGDSVITESVSGFIGIGTGTPETLLQVGPNTGYGTTNGLLMSNNLIGSQFDRAFQLAPRQTASPGTNSVLMYALPTVNPGVTVPMQYGIFVDGKQGTGNINSYAAIGTGQTASLGATNNTHLLLGTSVIPAGNFAIYDNTGFNSFFSGKVGIGDTQPSFKLHLVDPSNTGLRVQTNTGGGTVASFGGNGDFQIDAVNVPAGRLVVKENGNVGIGTTNGAARSKLDVRGNIQLGNGGQYFATGGEENLRIVRGVVGYTGNIIVGSGFHVSIPEQGKFIVTFDSPFAAPPAVTVTPDRILPGIMDRIAMTDGVTASTANIRLVFRDSGDNAWGTFHFIAIGPR